MINILKNPIFKFIPIKRITPIKPQNTAIESYKSKSVSIDAFF
jgi:hypothetical protein